MFKQIRNTAVATVAMVGLTASAQADAVSIFTKTKPFVFISARHPAGDTICTRKPWFGIWGIDFRVSPRRW